MNPKRPKRPIMKYVKKTRKYPWLMELSALDGVEVSLMIGITNGWIK